MTQRNLCGVTLGSCSSVACSLAVAEAHAQAAEDLSTIMPRRAPPPPKGVDAATARWMREYRDIDRARKAILNAILPGTFPSSEGSEDEEGPEDDTQ